MPPFGQAMVIEVPVLLEVDHDVLKPPHRAASKTSPKSSPPSTFKPMVVPLMSSVRRVTPLFD